MSQPSQKTTALIINVREHGESDKIVTFYCPQKGKLTAIAKGAKRSKKRFVNKLELFTELDIIYVGNRNSSLVRIDSAELINHYYHLRANYRLYVGAMLICELINLWTRENDGDDDLFALLTWALADLGKTQQPQRTVVLFMIRMLTILGFQPHLSNCLACGADDVKAAPYYFITHHGGIFCKNCRPAANSRQLPVAINTLKLLGKAQTIEQDKLNRLKFASNSIQESLKLLRSYTVSILHRDIHSWQELLATQEER